MSDVIKKLEMFAQELEWSLDYTDEKDTLNKVEEIADSLRDLANELRSNNEKT